MVVNAKGWHVRGGGDAELSPILLFLFQIFLYLASNLESNSCQVVTTSNLTITTVSLTCATVEGGGKPTIVTDAFLVLPPFRLTSDSASGKVFVVVVHAGWGRRHLVWQF